MPDLYFVAFAIQDHIRDKIAIKHGILSEEIDEAFYNSTMRIRRTRASLYKLYSQTDAGRYVVLIAAYRGSGRWQIATARDMSEAERREFQHR